MSEENFQVEILAPENRAVLRVTGERLSRSNLEAFQAACDQLLKTAMTELTIDGHQLHMISSVYIGVLINTGTQAKSQGQHLILACTTQIADILHKLVGDTLEIRVRND